MYVALFEVRQVWKCVRDTLRTLRHRSEIEIAHRLARAGVGVELAEPDLVITLPFGDRLGVACKRPRTVAAVPAKIRHAASQVHRQDLPGIIAIDLEPVLHSAGRNRRRRWVGIFEIGHPDQLADAASRVAAEVRRRADEATRRAFEKRVGGVYYWGLFTGVCRDPSGYFWHWHREWEAAPTAELLMAAFDRLMFGSGEGSS